MHLLFLAVRQFPWWAVPVAVIFWQLGAHFHRRDNRLKVPCFAAAGILVLCTLLWFVFRGDIHSDAWVRALLGN